MSYRHRNYKNQLATKRYVEKRIEDESWSPVYRVNIDFQNDSVDGGNGTTYDLNEIIYGSVFLNNLYTRVVSSTDSIVTKECDYKISYIRLHVRCATGENETSSAVSQTVRFILYRHNEDWILGSPGGVPSIISDVDSMPLYSNLYGEINGLWYDKTQYVHSWATDADTTCGGQVMFKKVKKNIKHSDTMIFDSGENVSTSKGSVWLQVVGDDPTGTNSSFYGWIEVGFRYKTN